MKQTIDLRDRILTRLQTKGATKVETLTKELEQTLGMVLVALYDLRNQGFVKQNLGGVWSATIPE